MNEQINRLGFDAWGDNKFANAIEDYEGQPVVKRESDNYSMVVTFAPESVNCVIRAYTGLGWETYDKTIKR